MKSRLVVPRGIFTFTMSDLLTDVLHRIQLPLFVLAQSNSLLFANAAFAELLSGRAQSEVVELSKLNVRDFFPECASFQDEDDLCIVPLIGVDGSEIRVRSEVVLLNGGARLFIVHGLQSEPATETFHSQRLETLGMLAGGIAHDFNNILAGILGHVTYLKTVLPASGSHQESLIAVEDGARKASAMTKQILDFSKLDTEERPLPVDIGALAEGTFRLLKGAIPPSYHLQFKCEMPGIAILGVEGKIAQVIANLVINARDALGDGGQIDVSVSIVQGDDHLLALFHSDELTSARYACLHVRDNGMGMSEEVLARVFEPYFTTKGVTGTGLGLATVHQIVHSFGGAIEISSEPGEGTSVCVYFPLLLEDSHGTEGAQAESNFTPTLVSGTESILVVDDEYSVRNVLAMSLDHLGYSVQTAASGMEALEVFEQAPEVIDLVILDMLMPKLPGEEVFARLREIRADVRVLVISGFSSEEAVNQILESGGLGFVQKPFTIEELSQKVRACLDCAL